GPNSGRKLRKARQVTKFSATALPSAYTVHAQKWWKTKLTVATTRNQTKRTFSFLLMAIPPDLSAPGRPKRTCRRRKQLLRLFGRRLLRLRSLIADYPDFADQIGHLHAAERFDQGGP